MRRLGLEREAAQDERGLAADEGVVLGVDDVARVGAEVVGDVEEGPLLVGNRVAVGVVVEVAVAGRAAEVDEPVLAEADGVGAAGGRA
jgi:hypothetical protein